MVKKIESIPEYVSSSHYRSIGVPIVTLIRDYNVNENCFGWKWKTTLYTENDDLVLWKERFSWFETPFSNYEFGLTENEMNTIVKQLKDSYDAIPHSAAPDASDFEQLIFNSGDGNSPDVRFAAGKNIMELGRWKAHKILSNDAFSNNVANNMLLEKLFVAASDAAAKMIIFKSGYSMDSGVQQSLRFAFKEEDYNVYLLKDVYDFGRE